MRILIFDADGKLKHDLERVRSRGINPYGDFVARFGPEAPRKVFVAYRGTWDHLEEWDDRNPEPVVPGAAGLADRPTERVTLATQPTPPVVPGPYDTRPDSLHTAMFDEVPSVVSVQMPDPLLSLPNPYAGQLADVLAIHCQCANLRCPVVLNPSTAGERTWWRMALRGAIARGVTPDAPSPFRQCVHEDEHAPREDGEAHEWTEGGWPYGPHNHHPRCPRHPENYNRPQAEEGHPVTGGLTSADQLAAEPPADPSVHTSAPDWVTAPTTDRTLVRPFITGQHRAN